jgi:catechol 2,3-dioxygenase-like lactoylglutathione lyase family enzyme
MLATSKVIAFTATTNPDAALVFYRDVLGLTLISDEPYAIVFDAGGTMLRVQKTMQHTSAPHTLLGWEVHDVTSAVRGLVARGVAFRRYDGMGQDDDGIWTAPGGGKIAWFNDPDGNTLSLTQFT